MKKLVAMLALSATVMFTTPTAHAGFWSGLWCSISEIGEGLGCTVGQTVDLAWDIVVGSIESSGVGGIDKDGNYVPPATFGISGKAVVAGIKEWVNDVFTDNNTQGMVFNKDDYAANFNTYMGTYLVNSNWDGDGLSCWNDCNPIDDCEPAYNS